MMVASFAQSFRQFAHSEALRTDFSRAIRGAIAFTAPLVLGPLLHWPLAISFVALAAQNIAIVDVRGPYSLRLTLLLAMSLILAGYAAVGSLAAGAVGTALVATAALTLLSGVWRHLSSDYGPSLAIASLLMLFLSFAGAAGHDAAKLNALSILAGGGIGIFLQIAFWPVRPQHPLRRNAAESWLAAGDLFAALVPSEKPSDTARHAKVVDAENALRAAVDKTALLLIQAGAKRQAPILARLEDLNLCAARLAVRVVALNTALEGCMSESAFASVAPALLPVLTALKNMSRTIGLAVVSRHPSQLAAARVRLRRAAGLLHVLAQQLQSPALVSVYRTQLEDILRQIERQLPEIASSLEATIERADERAAFPVELFDLDTWMLRPLAATLNLHWHVERALVRYSVRLATLTTLGVWVFKAWHLPHGYWLPFTSVVVLQPDFGATRQRAAQRVAGTVLGSLVASVLLWIHLGPVGHIVAIALCVFAFAYVLRRHYGVAIFFVTIFVVLLLESAGASTWAVMIERVCATLGGGLLAFIAALLFWPYWERERLPQYLADALRRNADYVRGLGEILRGGENAHARLTPLKRGVERANNTAFTSLRRMFADPAHQREGVERLAAIANGNQRITRLFNLVYVQLVETVPPPEPDAANFCEAAARLLILIADAEQNRALDRNELKKVTDELMRTTPAAMGDASERAWLAVNLNRAATELGALAVIAEREFVLTSAMSQNTALANPQPSVAGGASPTASA